MAGPVIIASYGGAQDNSYLTVDRATDLITTNFLYWTDWEDADGDDRARALIMAANALEGITWVGERFFYNQALVFPRSLPGQEMPWGGFNPREEPTGDFYTYIQQAEDQQRMLRRVEIAVCAQALEILKHGGEDPHRDTVFAGIRSRGRGSKFSDSASYAEAPWGLCPRAWDQVRHYKGSPRLVRG
jgi:hypothetical protein